jgi:hypothetical protein
LCIIKNTDGGDICLNDYWYELCNKAKEDIILSTDTFLPITCCCLSSQTKSALFYYPSLEPNGNPKVEQYHYDQQWLFKVIAKHNNFTTDGLVIACWGDGDKCNINKEKRQLLIQKKVAVLLHNFEKTENDILSSLYSNNNSIFIPDHLFLRSNGYKDLISSMIFIVKNSKDKMSLFNIGPNDKGVTVKFISQEVARYFKKNKRIVFEKKTKGWVGDVPKFSYSNKKFKKLGFDIKSSSKSSIIKAVRELIE